MNSEAGCGAKARERERRRFHSNPFGLLRGSAISDRRIEEATMNRWQTLATIASLIVLAAILHLAPWMATYPAAGRIPTLSPVWKSPTGDATDQLQKGILYLEIAS